MTDPLHRTSSSMPESPPPSAKANRFHSAVRNRRWQMITAVGAGLIVAVWLLSLFHQLDVNVPVKKRGSVWIRSHLSRLQIHHVGSPWWLHHFKIDSYASPLELGCPGPGSLPQVLFPRPGLESGKGLVRIRIPYWLFLAAFLAIQYALLPKSRPATESRLKGES